MDSITDPTELLDPSAYQSPDLHADLIMKGGITSGVVFPLAICELAKRYRLRNIAGTSAGAIAAALAAAAEYGRARGKNGFVHLARLPRWLGEEEEGRRHCNMLGLFQPAPSTWPLFELLLLALAPGRLLGKLLKTLLCLFFRVGERPWVGALPGSILAVVLISRKGREAIWAGGVALGLLLLAVTLGLGISALRLGKGWSRRIQWALAASFAGTVVVGGPLLLSKWTSAAPTLAPMTWGQEFALSAIFLGALTGGLAAIAAKMLGDVPENLFGICSGNTEKSGEGREALTPWLAGQIQKMAGRTTEDAPLCFEELRKLPDHPVNLRMMTTCVTLGRPYLLPLETKIFYFDPAEFRRLFPEWVVNHLVKQATLWSRSEDPEDQPNDTDRLVNRFMYPRLPLPREKLPIVVAARMSLSFPLLLSAVPLWHIDWRRKANQEANTRWAKWKRENREAWKDVRNRPEAALPGDAPKESPEPERCWFSDGGICSNFPVHLFDPLLPKRPTFAINLIYGEKADLPRERVTLPTRAGDGILEPWCRLSRDSKTHGSISGFLGVIAGTMQNWTDNSMLRIPGFRDRIVHLHLTHDEGGMNLHMSSEQIEQLAEWGRMAGVMLRQRFTKIGAKGSQLSWDSHRWTRFRTAMYVLQEQLEELVETYEAPAPPSTKSYLDLILRKGTEHPASYRWSKMREQRVLAEQTMVRLKDLIGLWQGSSVGFRDDKAPHPRTDLQFRGRLNG